MLAADLKDWTTLQRYKCAHMFYYRAGKPVVRFAHHAEADQDYRLWSVNGVTTKYLEARLARR